MVGRVASLAFCACALVVLAATASAWYQQQNYIVAESLKKERCQAPCVKLWECGWLAALVHHKPRPVGLAELMHSLVCGRDGRFLHFCCGPPPEQPQNQPQPEPQPGPLVLPDPQPDPQPHQDRPLSLLSQLTHPNLRLLPTETCGLDDSDRITRGNVTAVNQYPWMALLAYSSRGGPREYLCGGSLITARYVLTASHCVHRQKLGSYSLVGVRLGEWDLQTDVDCKGEICAPPPQDFGLEEAILHPSYQPQAGSSAANDIALLRLDADAPNSAFIRPVCLPITPEMRQKSFVGTKLVVSGWGITEFGDRSPVKLYVGVPVVDEQTCQQRYSRWNRRILPSHLCAGGVEGKDSCSGDSGGPLMTLEGEPPRGFLIGIVSFGPRECGSNGYPAVYTRVASYLTWILDNIRP